jgi:hypothetical protein
VEEVLDRRQYRDYYLRQWKYHRQRFHERAAEIRSVQMDSLVHAHDVFLQMHLGSQGLI